MKISHQLMDRMRKEREGLFNAWAMDDYNKQGKKSIYVIDDCTHTLNLVSKALTKDSSLQVSIYEDEMIAMTNIIYNPPDLVILDMNLSLISGESVSKIIGILSPIDIPIVFITADETFIKRYEKKTHKYLLLKKPIERDYLLKLVNELIYKQAA